MDTPDRIDARLTDLEIKLSFTEDMTDELSAIIARQQLQIDQLMREVIALKNQAPVADSPGTRSLRDELPPHY